VESCHFEYRAGDGRITLRWILGRYVVRNRDSESRPVAVCYSVESLGHRYDA
jgi:hypothetical protein